MKVYTCSLCGFVYDEAEGSPESGIAPGTPWDSLPGGWVCPLCGATKAEFDVTGSASEEAATAVSFNAAFLDSLSSLEKSILCSNMARGFEKQYQAEKASLLFGLADFFREQADPAESPRCAALAEQVDLDIRDLFVRANEAAAAANDRGAKRALVWAEKVTKIQKSILSRLEKEGDALIADKDVYVCSICGFIYIGSTLPDLCPICKVPNWKFETVKAG